VNEFVPNGVELDSDQLIDGEESDSPYWFWQRYAVGADDHYEGEQDLDQDDDVDWPEPESADDPWWISARSDW
jgi:hypothetical protein